MNLWTLIPPRGLLGRKTGTGAAYARSVGIQHPCPQVEDRVAAVAMRTTLSLGGLGSSPHGVASHLPYLPGFPLPGRLGARGPLSGLVDTTARCRERLAADTARDDLTTAEGTSPFPGYVSTAGHDPGCPSWPPVLRGSTTVAEVPSDRAYDQPATYVLLRISRRMRPLTRVVMGRFASYWPHISRRSELENFASQKVQTGRPACSSGPWQSRHDRFTAISRAGPRPPRTGSSGLTRRLRSCALM